MQHQRPELGEQLELEAELEDLPSRLRNEHSRPKEIQPDNGSRKRRIHTAIAASSLF
jgi:hypothetical protein